MFTSSLGPSRIRNPEEQAGRHSFPIARKRVAALLRLLCCVLLASAVVFSSPWGGKGGALAEPVAGYRTVSQAEPTADAAHASAPGAACGTGAQLAAAFANPNVAVIHIPVDISITPADWAPYAVPVRLDRNLTLLGTWPKKEDWPVLELAYLRALVELAPAVVLNFSRVLIWHGRQWPHFQAPGLDLVMVKSPLPVTATAGSDGAAAPPRPTVLVWGGAFSRRTCIPPSLSPASFASLPRPVGYPGPQLTTRANQSADCVVTNSPRTLRDCWPYMGFNYDLATYGMDVDVYGNQVAAGYLLVIVQSYATCETVMSDECIQRSGLFGCFRSMFNSNGTDGAAAATAAAQQQADASGSRGSSGGSSSSSSVGGMPSSDGTAAAISSSAQGTAAGLVMILAGTLGGMAALLSAVIIVMVVAGAWTQRRRRRRRLAAGGLSAVARVTTSSGSGGPSSKSSAESPCSDRMLSPNPDGQSDPEGMPYRSHDFGSGGNACDVVGAGNGAALMLLTTDVEAAGGERCVSLEQGKDTFPGATNCAAESPPEQPRSTASLDLHRISWPPDKLQPELLPVTLSTPPDPAIPYDVRFSEGELQIEPNTLLGKGSYGRVVTGVYGGVRVAVKMINAGLFEGADLAVGIVKASGDGPHVSGAGQSGGADEQEGGLHQQQQQQQQRQPQQLLKLPTLEVQEAQKALLQEVEVLARCQHPNIVRLLAASLEPPRICLVMELMDTSLDRLLHGDAKRPATCLPLATVVHVGMQVARALSYLHPTILHRDLKPANVLISQPDSLKPLAKLADFGVSRLLQSVLVTMNPEAGTTPYMAPEVFDVANNTFTDRVDMYSFGVLLWEMLAGKKPWAGCSHMQIAVLVAVLKNRLPLSSMPDERCPSKLRTLIHRCWEADPARRPAAAEAYKTLALVQERLAQEGATVK